MARKVEFESTVKGGLPVTVFASIYPPEPDVGIFHNQVEITDIKWIGKKPKSVPDCIWDYAMKHDFERLEMEAVE